MNKLTKPIKSNKYLSSNKAASIFELENNSSIILCNRALLALPHTYSPTLLND